jgi:hypothetical protein
MRVVDGAFSRWACTARQPRGLRQLFASATGLGGPGGSGGRSERSGELPPGAGLPDAGAAASPSFTLDHIFDDRLAPLRLTFAAVRLRSAEGLEQLISSGFEYGRRLQERGIWAAWLRAGSAAAAAA